MARVSILTFLCVALILGACDESRVYDEYVDFDDRQWLVTDKPEFSFRVTDASPAYNLVVNLRNASSYPNSRIFVNFQLQDSTGQALHKSLLTEYLFEAKTGKPLGKSGLGDIYDHRIPALSNFRFQRPGLYKVRLEQYMRTDTLGGVLSVGVAVERAEKEN